jgi:hypothetical protein
MCGGLGSKIEHLPADGLALIDVDLEPVGNREPA